MPEKSFHGDADNKYLLTGIMSVEPSLDGKKNQHMKVEIW